MTITIESGQEVKTLHIEFHKTEVDFTALQEATDKLKESQEKLQATTE